MHFKDSVTEIPENSEQSLPYKYYIVYTTIDPEGSFEDLRAYVEYEDTNLFNLLKELQENKLQTIVRVCNVKETKMNWKSWMKKHEQTRT